MVLAGIEPPERSFLIEALKAILARPFVCNVLTVATGTAAAQMVAMAFVPLITRQYGPEAYGLQSIFVSLVGILATLAALGYPMAIVLPRSDGSARSLVRLSVCLTVATALLLALLLLTSGRQLLAIVNAEQIASVSYLLPLAVIFTSLSVVLVQWLIRNAAFSIVAGFEVLNATLSSLGKVAMGMFIPTAAVLITLNTAAAVVSVALGYLGWRRFARDRVLTRNPEGANSLRRVAKQYADFPLLRTPQNLINAISQSLPVVLLASYFGPATAGYYSIAATVLGIPASLIGGAVMSVFYRRINAAVANGEDARALIVQATLGMALTGGIPYLIVLLFGPTIFAAVFGDGWRAAGDFAQWLSVWFFLQYLNKPAVAAVPALHMQGRLLIYEVFSTVSKLVALWIGYRVFQSANGAVALFSISGVIAYIWLIYWIVRRSGAQARSTRVDDD